MANRNRLNTAKVNQGSALGAGPSVTITSPASGAIATPGSAITFTCSANDPVDGVLSGASVEWFLDGSPTPFHTGTTFTKSDVPFGAHSVVAKVTNSAAQTATSAAVSFKVDTAPGIASITPGNGSSSVSGASVNFVPTATDADTGSGDSVTVALVSSLDGPLGSGPSGSTIAHVLTTIGTHTITATPTDSLGVAGTPASVTHIVKATPTQTQAITGPVSSGGSTTVPTGSIVHLTANANDPTDGPLTGASVKWYSSLVGGGATVVGTGVALDVSTLPVGSQTVTCKATNSGAVTVSDSITIVVANADGMRVYQLTECTQFNTIIAPAVMFQLTRGGADWAQPNVSATLTKTNGTGSGALSGTTTRSTDSTGKVSFDDVKLSTAGSYTLVATVASLSVTASDPVVIRPAAHSFNSTWNSNATASIPPLATSPEWYTVDRRENKRVQYRVWNSTSILTPASPGAASPLMYVFTGVNSEADQMDIGTMISGSVLVTGGFTSAAFATAGLGCIGVVIQRSSNDAGGAAKGSARRAFGQVLLQLLSDGWNIDLKRVYYGGYSTGAIEGLKLSYEYPNLFAGMILIDGNFHSYNWYNGTNVFNGPRLTAPPAPSYNWSFPTAAFFDPTVRDDGSQGGPDALGEVARVLVASQNSILWLCGTNNTEYLPQRITQPDGTANTDYVPTLYRVIGRPNPLRAKITALGAATLRSKATGASPFTCPALDVSIRFHQVDYNDGNNNYTDGSPTTVATGTGYAGLDHASMNGVSGPSSYSSNPNVWNYLFSRQRATNGNLGGLPSTGNSAAAKARYRTVHLLMDGWTV